jgi:hypothetical protein
MVTGYVTRGIALGVGLVVLLALSTPASADVVVPIGVNGRTGRKAVLRLRGG